MAIDTAGVLAIFRVYATEFASTADATVNALTGIIGPRVHADAFGDVRSEAIARRVAHELTMQARATSASLGAAGVGPVSSIGSGDLSISFGASAPSSYGDADAELRQTRHGLAYLALRDERAAVLPALIV